MCGTLGQPLLQRALRRAPLAPTPSDAARAELKEFWKAYDAAAETNAGLGVGQGAAAAPAAAEAGKEEAAKAADALADSLGGVKVADADKPAA